MYSFHCSQVFDDIYFTFKGLIVHVWNGIKVFAGCFYFIHLWSMVLFCYKLAFLKDNGASASSLRFPVMDYLGKITFPVSSGFYPFTLGMFLSDLLSESDAYKNLRWRCIDIARSVVRNIVFPFAFCSCG